MLRVCHFPLCKWVQQCFAACAGRMWKVVAKWIGSGDEIKFKLKLVIGGARRAGDKGSAVRVNIIRVLV